MKAGVFEKLQQGLSKTKSGLVGGIQRAVSAARGMDEELLEELEQTLILGDVGVATTEAVIDALRSSGAGRGGGKNNVIEIVKDELLKVLGSAPGAAPPPEVKPLVVSVIGVNGTGKTTTIAKLAHRWRADGKRVLLAAADTFRAAAIDQLRVWAERSGSDIVHNQPGSDPAAVAYDALQASMSRHTDVLIIDTAGRLHTKSNLMAELTKVHRVLDRALPGAPHEVLLVMDATTGQNGLSQARQFAASVRITGIVLTKLDGTAKGGMVFSVVQELGLPVKYIGLGERIDDLEPFEAESFVEALFR